jgi:hypothetical protein
MSGGGALYRDVEMEVNDLADFMFKRNVNNVVLDLSLGGIENNKDLFFFILDLFCKGLVLLFGGEQKSVDVDSITLDDFGTVKEKMGCAGININLAYYPNDIELQDGEVVEMSKRALLNLDEINNAPDNKPLEEYVFKLLTIKNQYIISFNLIHRTF